MKMFLSLLSGDLWKQNLDVSKVIGVGSYWFKWLSDSHWCVCVCVRESSRMWVHMHAWRAEVNLGYHSTGAELITFIFEAGSANGTSGWLLRPHCLGQKAPEPFSPVTQYWLRAYLPLLARTLPSEPSSQTTHRHLKTFQPASFPFLFSLLSPNP